MKYYENLAGLAAMMLLSGLIAARAGDTPGGTKETASAGTVTSAGNAEEKKNNGGDSDYNGNSIGVVAIAGVEQSGFSSLTNQTGPFVSLFFPHWPG